MNNQMNKQLKRFVFVMPKMNKQMNNLLNNLRPFLTVQTVQIL